MRQVFLEKGILAIKEVCEPELDEHSVLVAVHYSFVSAGIGLANTFEVQQERLFVNVPQKIKKIVELIRRRGIDYTTQVIKERLQGRLITLGATCSGVVIAVGSGVKRLRVGDLVACVGQGLANHADIVCMPEQYVARVQSAHALKYTSIAGVGAMAMHSVKKAHVHIGQTVAVFGEDAYSFLIKQLVKLSGGIIVDKTHKNVDTIFITPHAIEKNTIEQAISAAQYKGKIILGSSQSIYLPSESIHHKEIEIIFMCAYGSGHRDELNDKMEYHTLQTVVNLIESGQLDVSSLAQQIYEVEDIDQAVDAIEHHEKLGVVLAYNTHHKINEQELSDHLIPDQETLFIPAFKEVMHVGIMGITPSIKHVVLPYLARQKNTTIERIVDEYEITPALAIGRLYQGAKVSRGTLDNFINDKCNVVVTGSFTYIDIEVLISLLNQSKAVILSNIPATRLPDLEKLKKYCEDNPQALLSVAYQRSYAPFIKKIKALVVDRQSPLILTYRINIGPAQHDHKFSVAHKFGRVITHMAPIIDMLCTITESHPVSVSVESLRPIDTLEIFPTDNLVVTMSFADGSIGTIIQTALGNKQAVSERLDLWYDTVSIVMEDFITLKSFGTFPLIEEKIRHPEYGYDQFLGETFDNLQQNIPFVPRSLSSLMIINRAVLLIDNLACRGGGESSL